MIKRVLMDVIKKKFFKGKALIIVGPRQSGKTTLLMEIRKSINRSCVYLNCDEPDVRNILTDATSTQLRELMQNEDFVLIDEAQRVKNIGITLKLIIDQIPEKQLIVTGSSSIDLSTTLAEPLTGRKFEYTLLPLSTGELVANNGRLNESRLLEQRLIFGMYPDVVSNMDDKNEILKMLAESYLYKDILSYGDVRRPHLLSTLLEALALQVGWEVSHNELSQLLGVDSSTISRYIDLLEKCFVVFRLRSFSRNIRNELKKSQKVFFYDNGVRNVIINNLNPLRLRADTGALWENFLMSERIKFNIASQNYCSSYFWRTRNRQEIDLIEVKDGEIFAYEFKWREKRSFKFTPSFIRAYPNSKRTIITKENYLDFIVKNGEISEDN